MSMISAIRRTVVALGIASVVAAYLRVNSESEVPTSDGGWRELSGPDFD